MNEIKRPVLKPYSKDKFELVEDYRYGDVIVPKSYKTNGANVPRLFWSIFPPNSPEYLSAVVAHDYLCDQAEIELNKRKYDKPQFAKSDASSASEDGLSSSSVSGGFKLADAVLKTMMSELGVAKWKIYCFYTACRIWHKIKYRK
jgi:hypothetical protein